MATVNIYLNFNGNCEEVFTFYKSVFGGDFRFLGRFADMPPGADGQSVSAVDANKIMHVSLPVSKETVLMGCDTAGEWAGEYRRGNNFAVSISPESREEAERLFAGLSAGGVVTMPLQDTFWNAYFGMFTDQFGINWMVNYEQAAG